MHLLCYTILMIKRADKILVLDLELTCWRDIAPEGMQPEIIQIGWCFLNPHTGDITGQDALYVQPAHSTVSAYCTELTGITPEQCKTAQPLQAVTARLTKLGLKQYACAGYGDDWACVQAETELVDANSFLSESYIDISLLTKLALGRYKNLSLSSACRHFGVTTEGQMHRADWDARNAAVLLAVLLQTNWRDIVVE